MCIGETAGAGCRWYWQLDADMEPSRAEMLLNKGAALETKDDFNRTPSSQAANWGGLK